MSGHAEIENKLLLAEGSGSHGEYHLSGRELRVGTIAVGKGDASFLFEGGSLQANHVDLNLVQNSGVPAPGKKCSVPGQDSEKHSVTVALYDFANEVSAWQARTSAYRVE